MSAEISLDLGGRKIIMRRPITKALVWVLLIALLIPTLPIHIVKYLFDGRGLMKGRSYEAGWLILVSIAFYIVLIVLVVA